MAEEQQYDLRSVCSHFRIDGTYIEAIPYGTGHINDTYASRFRTDTGTVRYIHQRINHDIFRNVAMLMDNITRVTKHVRAKVIERGGDPLRESLTLVPAEDGAAYVRDEDGTFWRTYIFIEGARTYDIIEKPVHVFNASAAFGDFQNMLSDLPGKPLHETIPDFHNTKKRFGTFVSTLEKDPENRAGQAGPEIDFVLQREKDASLLIDLIGRGEVPLRVTHNDTKFNNVMIDDATDEGICVIDLDTVMPGLVMYDFGDSVRIGASTALEDEQDLSNVHMDIDLFEQLTSGYLSTARKFLTPAEIANLAFSAKLLTFECGMRFLTDFIDGDNYFKVHRPGHNLDRCRTQFKMVKEMEEQMQKMESIVEQHAQEEGE